MNPGPRPAIGHMPFPGHRTQQQVREDDARRDIMRTSRVRREEARR
jgi:hypothetical protein